MNAIMWKKQPVLPAAIWTRNDSRNVKYIAEKIAEIKKMPLEKIANITYENTKKILKIE